MCATKDPLAIAELRTPPDIDCRPPILFRPLSFLNWRLFVSFPACIANSSPTRYKIMSMITFNSFQRSLALPGGEQRHLWTKKTVPVQSNDDNPSCAVDVIL